MHSKSNQHGSVTVLAMVSLLIMTSLAGVYFNKNISGLSKTFSFNYGQQNSAQAVAEAGIQYVWAHALENTPDNTRAWNTTTLSSNPIKIDNTNDNSPTFTVSITKITTNLPAGVTANDSYYKVSSTGIVGSTSKTVVAYLLIPSATPPVLTSYFNNAAFSDKPWSISGSGENASATAPDGKNYYQVLFNQKVYSNDENHLDPTGNLGFTLNYKVNLKSTSSTNPNDCGYGIYYLANGNPNNLSGYVLQYDPGLTPDQILVKKVVADYKSTTTPWYNEIISNNYEKLYSNNYYNNQSWQKSTKAATWSKNSDNSYNLNTNPLSGQDTMSIPMSTALNQLNKVTNKNNTMLNQSHILTIDVRPDASGKVIHTISLDGLPILRFIDRDTKPDRVFSSGLTGLRVWNANAEFQNYGSAGIQPIIIRSWEIER